MSEVQREIYPEEIVERIDKAEAFQEAVFEIAPMAEAGYEDAVQFTQLPEPGREVFLPTEGAVGRVVSLNRIRANNPGENGDWRIEVEGYGFFRPNEIGYRFT